MTVVAVDYVVVVVEVAFAYFVDVKVGCFAEESSHVFHFWQLFCHQKMK